MSSWSLAASSAACSKRITSIDYDLEIALLASMERGDHPAPCLIRVVEVIGHIVDDRGIGRAVGGDEAVIAGDVAAPLMDPDPIVQCLPLIVCRYHWQTGPGPSAVAAAGADTAHPWLGRGSVPSHTPSSGSCSSNSAESSRSPHQIAALPAWSGRLFYILSWIVVPFAGQISK